MKKSQVSVEFIVAVSIMFFIFVGFTAIMSTRLIELQEEKYYQQLMDVGSDAAKEIRVASLVEDGYERTFVVPLKAEGMGYYITLYEYNYPVRNASFLIIQYANFSLNQTRQINLPDNVRGNIYKGKNNITKKQGIVCLNKDPCP